MRQHSTEGRAAGYVERSTDATQPVQGISNARIRAIVFRAGNNPADSFPFEELN